MINMAAGFGCIWPYWWLHWPLVSWFVTHTCTILVSSAILSRGVGRQSTSLLRIPSLSVSLSPLFSGTCLLDFRWLKVRPTLDKFPSLLWPGVTQNWPLDSVRGTLREALPSQTYNFILCCHETIYIHIYALQTIRFKTYQLVILNVYTCNILMTALTLRNIYLYHIHWLHF